MSPYLEAGPVNVLVSVLVAWVAGIALGMAIAAAIVQTRRTPGGDQ